MAKKKPAYDTSIPEDAETVRVLQMAGYSVRERQPRDLVMALKAMTDEQVKQLRQTATAAGTIDVKHAGVSLVTHRRKLEGSEVREVEAKTIKRSTLPRCIWWLPDRLRDALEDYQSLLEATIPSAPSGFQPRMEGGGISTDRYEEETFKELQRANGQINAKERRRIEWALRLDDDALVSINNTFLLRSGASKLAEYFEENNLY